MNLTHAINTITIRALLGPKDPKFGGKPRPLIFQREFEFGLDSNDLVQLICNGTILIPRQCTLSLEPSQGACKYLGIEIDPDTNQLILNTTGRIAQDTPEYLAFMINEGWEQILTNQENAEHYNLDIKGLPDIKPKIFVRFDKAPSVNWDRLRSVIDAPSPPQFRSRVPR